MTGPDPVAAATWFIERGYKAFPVWGIGDDLVCQCPKGKTCDNPGKHPATVRGFKDATSDVERVKTFLANAGTHNYGLVPPPHIGVIDVDGDGRAKWDALQLELGPLPVTLTTVTANGFHYHFDFGDDPVPPHLHGFIVRSIEKGYIIGVGSRHQSGIYYDLLRPPKPIAKLPERWKEETKPKPIQSGGTITVGAGAKQPEDVVAGQGRHDYLRDKARYYWGLGVSGEELFAVVNSFNLRFSEPKNEEAVRRAIGEVAQFPHDPKPVDATAIPVTTLFIKQQDYHAANASVPLYVSPLVAYGTVSLVSGPPKGGKSTLISNLFAARQDGTVFLWGDPVPFGPMALVTEEGGYPVVRKTVGLINLDILDRMAFVTNGLRTLDHLLAVMGEWVKAQGEVGGALVVIDTLAVWGDIKDENDAVAATKAIVALRVWAQVHGAAVILVHHTRKGGGEHGEAIRGSGGIFAAVDQSVELEFTNDPLSDDRNLVIAGRLTFGETKSLAFDRTTMTYSVTTTIPIEKHPTDQFPVDGSGQPGWTNVEAGSVWGMSPASANKHLKELADRGVLVPQWEQTPGSRARHLVYHRAKPLLDLGPVQSVGGQMADIFKD